MTTPLQFLVCRVGDMSAHPPTTPGPLPKAKALGDDLFIRIALPVGRSLWAIAAGYVGLFSVLLVPAPLAILLGVVAIVDIRRHPEKHGMGRAIFAIVMGVLCTILLAVIIVLRI